MHRSSRTHRARTTQTKIAQDHVRQRARLIASQQKVSNRNVVVKPVVQEKRFLSRRHEDSISSPIVGETPRTAQAHIFKKRAAWWYIRTHCFWGRILKIQNTKEFSNWRPRTSLPNKDFQKLKSWLQHAQTNNLLNVSEEWLHMVQKVRIYST